MNLLLSMYLTVTLQTMMGDAGSIWARLVNPAPVVQHCWLEFIDGDTYEITIAPLSHSRWFTEHELVEWGCYQ